MHFNFDLISQYSHANIPFTVKAELPGLRMEARLTVTLFWYKPLSFCNVNAQCSEVCIHTRSKAALR